MSAMVGFVCIGRSTQGRTVMGGLKDHCNEPLYDAPKSLQLSYKPGSVSCQEQEDDHSSPLDITIKL